MKIHYQFIETDKLVVFRARQAPLVLFVGVKSRFCGFHEYQSKVFIGFAAKRINVEIAHQHYSYHSCQSRETPMVF